MFLPHKLLPLLLLAGPLLIAGCSSKTPAPPIYFGQLAPRSGADRDYGLGTEKAILLAAEDARGAEGQVLNRPVAVLHLDSRSDPEAAQSQAVRLITVNHAVGLIGGPEPAVQERLCRLAQQYKAPLITPAWLPSEALQPYGFSIAPAPADQGKALASFAVKQRQARQTAVILDDRCPACLVLGEAFAATVGKEAVAFQGEFAGADQLAGLAKQAVAAEPQAILFAGTGADLEKFRSALQQAGMKEEVFLLFGGPEDHGLPALTASWAGSPPLYWTTLFVAGSGPPKARDFARKFQERFGRPPVAAEALAYDAANLLFEALRRAQAVNGEKAAEQLAGLKDFEAVTGTIQFTRGHAVGRPVVVVHSRDRQVQVVWDPAGQASKEQPK